MYMFRIAGQTSGPFELKFFVDTHGGCYNLKIFENYFIKFFSNFFFPSSWSVFYSSRTGITIVLGRLF